MSDKFSLDDFNTAPEPDAHVLLDEITKAAEIGTTKAAQPILVIHKETQRQMALLASKIQQMQGAETRLQKAANSFTLDLIIKAVIAIAAATALTCGIALAYQIMKDPKVEYMGCTKWNAQTKTCDGEWRPLREAS